VSEFIIRQARENVFDAELVTSSGKPFYFFCQRVPEKHERHWHPRLNSPETVSWWEQTDRDQKKKFIKLFNKRLDEALSARKSFGDTLVAAEKAAYALDLEKAIKLVHSYKPGSAVTDSTGFHLEDVPAFDPKEFAVTSWLKENFIPKKNVTVVFGKRGSFKSSGMIWLLKPISKDRLVLILDYENPPNLIKRWNSDFRLHLGEDPQNLVVWDRTKAAPPKADDPRLETIVKEARRKQGHSPVIVFDSFASMLKPGESGHTTGEVAPIFTHFRKLCDLGATVIVYDHTRKYEADVAYGGEDKEAKADVFHKFIVHPNEKHPEEPTVEVRVNLKRYAPEGTANFAFKPDPYKDDDGVWHIKKFDLTKDPVEAERRHNRALLKKIIRENPGASKREIGNMASERGLSKHKAEALLDRWEGKYWSLEHGRHRKVTYKLLETR